MRLPERGGAVRRLGLGLPPAGAAPTGPRPAGMPLVRWARPLKRWRYIGVFGPQLMLCGAEAFIGPLRQRFWAVVERDRPLVECTSLGSAGLRLDGSRLTVDSMAVSIDVSVSEDAGMESVASSGRHGYSWTRKQAGVPASGFVRVDGRNHRVDALAVVDDSAGYHARHVAWRWSAGVGRGAGGERIGWNLVEGINDPPERSERTVWVDGRPAEAPPATFAADLSSVRSGDAELAFTPWAERTNETNVLLLLRSSYRQPFGTFSGELPGGIKLAEGYGVMEHHDVHW